MRLLGLAALAALALGGCREGERLIQKDVEGKVVTDLHPKPQEQGPAKPNQGEVPEPVKRLVHAGHHAYEESEKQGEQGSENGIADDQTAPKVDPRAPLVR